MKWFGLDDVESSWEPAVTVAEDVPVLYQSFVAAVKQRQPMAHAVENERRATADRHAREIASPPRVPRPCRVHFETRGCK